eukprot:6588924-Pyramimonas_sp.AAC.1
METDDDIDSIGGEAKSKKLPDVNLNSSETFDSDLRGPARPRSRLRRTLSQVRYFTGKAVMILLGFAALMM